VGQLLGRQAHNQGQAQYRPAVSPRVIDHKDSIIIDE
jgi:hypothetical protein